MKQIFRFAAVVAAIASFFSCQKVEGPDTQELKAPVVTVDPTEKITLSEDAKDAEALTISWTSVADDAEYTLNITPAKEADYSEAWKKTTTETSVKFTTEELQQLLIGLGYAQGELATVKAMVEAKSGELTSASADARVQCVLYAHIVDLNVPVVTLSSTAVVLDEATKNEVALTATWTDASVEEVYVDYTFEWTLATDTGFASASKVATEGREFTATGAELHYALIDLGYKAGETVNLICRVKAEPAVAGIEAVTSEVVAFSVKLFEKAKNENIPNKISIVGNAVANGWDYYSGRDEEGNKIYIPEATFTNLEEKGKFEWTGTILNIDTFKFLFDGSWGKGMRPGEGDYYWADIAYAPDMGDDDYFRLLVPGQWKIVLDVYNVSAELTLIETSLETISISMGETEVTIPVKDKTKAIFEGTVNLTAGQDFMVYTASDHSRSFSCHPSSAQDGTSWKLFERRESDQSNLHFRVLDSGDYTLTVDLINRTMTATAL